MSLLRKEFQILPTFSQRLTLQEAFEAATQKNEELKMIKRNWMVDILPNNQISASADKPYRDHSGYRKN